jgi:hypothetical protein
VRIGVAARGVGEEARETRRRRRRQTGADARLNHGVAALHQLAAFVRGIAINDRAIERMRQSFDHAARGVIGQLRIGIEGDDKAHAINRRARADNEMRFFRTCEYSHHAGSG